jgi:predicted  nucleic acid-binding Zn-ribbon protein
LSIVEQIKALEEVAGMDAEIRVLDEQIGKERLSLSSQRSSLSKLEEKLAQTRTSLTSLEKTRNDFVLEVRTMTTQLEHSREKLNRSRTERESNAAQREIEEMRKLIRDREEEAGRLTTDVEAQRRDLETTEAEAKKLGQELGATEGDAQARVSATEKERATKAAEREVIVKRLGALGGMAVYKRYEAIRQKRGTGIAQTSDGTCKACNMSLPPQLFHRLRREPMIEQCPSCYRIIYFVAPPVPEKPATEKGK